uniref:Uncharacterized protein n=2 Tax=Anguilla anguilla TaxID=7936 RepID=A0A0E9QNM4_ANGAN
MWKTSKPSMNRWTSWALAHFRLSSGFPAHKKQHTNFSLPSEPSACFSPVLRSHRKTA